MGEKEKNAVVEEVVQSPEELIPLSLSLSLGSPNPSSSSDFPTPTNPNSTLFPDPRSPSFARLLNHQSASYDLDSRDLDRSENGETDDDDDLVQTKKKRRTVWTLELHKKFSEAVNHLGVGNAGPKTIMERMNVDGLTRESVASHLQKYRDYLKLKLNSAGNSITDRQIATIPLPFAPAPAPPGYNVASSLPSTSQNVLHSRQIVGRVGAPCPVFLDIASPNVDEKIEEGGGETKELPLFPTGKA